MSAVISNQIAQELARDQKNAAKASTDAYIKTANTPRRASGFDSTPANIPHGELTFYGLEAVRNSLQRRKEEDMALAPLKALAGIAQDRELVRSDKDIARERLTMQMIKGGNPERLFQQICAGVASRNPETNRPFVNPNLGFWLAQQITNQICRAAGDAIIERRREAGITAGVHFEVDDLGVFNGTEATNTDDLEPARGGQRTSDNPFLSLDDPDTIEATFLDWYSEIEPILAALSGATLTANGGVMLYGHMSRWEDRATGLTQVIDSVDDYIARELVRRNDRDATPMPVVSGDNLTKLFG